MPIKLTYLKETQKLSKIPATFDTLITKITNIFKEKLPKYFIFEYEDKDGETFKICDNDDYKSMLETDVPHQLHTIKMNLIPIDQPLKEKDINMKNRLSKAGSDRDGTGNSLVKRFKDKLAPESRDNDNVSGVLALFNDLLNEKLACLEQITCKTDKHSKDTKITINFKKKEEGNNSKPKVIITSDGDENPESNNKYGHFKWGDTPKRVTKVSKKGDNLILSIEWSTRKNGEIPLESDITSAELRQYDHEFLLTDLVEFSKNRKALENTKKESEAAQSNSKKTKKGKENETKELVLKKPLVLPSLQVLHELPVAFNKALKDQNLQSLTEIAQLIRKIVSIDDSPPIEELVESGILPDLLSIMDKKYCTKKSLQIEACWIIANISSSDTEYVERLVSLGVIPKATELLLYCTEEVNDNIIWILANIAGDSIPHRDLLLKHRIVSTLERILSGKALQPSFLNNISWLISNLCRGKPYPDFEMVMPLLKILQIFIKIENPNILMSSLWALSYLTEGDSYQIEAVLQYDITKRIISLLSSENIQIQAPALRTVGNLLTGYDHHTQKLIDEGVLGPLFNLLTHEKKVFVKEACWAISNIMAGDTPHIQMVIDYENGALTDRLFTIARENKEWDILKEVIYCLTNPCSGGSNEQIEFLVNKGLIELLLKHLKNYKGPSALIISSLEAIQKILEAGKEIYNDDIDNPFITEIEEKGGFPILEKLQFHPDQKVYEAVSSIIEEFFFYEEIV